MLLRKSDNQKFFCDGCQRPRRLAKVQTSMRSDFRNATGVAMKDTVLALLISASLGFGLQQTALAADMPVKAPVRKAPPVVPVYDWSGFYVGAHIGGAWSNSTLTNSGIGTSWDPGGTGFIGGFQAGYNFQAGSFLFGVEG